eukprot:COSAG01_NODE_11080_length_2011_cov_2.835774_1_plen_490_part_10
MGDLAAWLGAVHKTCTELLGPLDDEYGIDEVEGLLDLDPEDIDRLEAMLKKSPGKKFRRALEALAIDAALPGDAAGAGPKSIPEAVPPHKEAAVAAGNGDQGGRVAAGLGPIAPMGSLAALFRASAQGSKEIVFIESFQPIVKAGCIPDVMDMAEVTLATAKDQKKFGKLKDDPLSVNGIAFLMKYSAEDTVPPLYKDLNDKAYVPDRSKIQPFGLYIVGTLQHMKLIEPYPNVEVFRGVKSDLKADYPKGREFTWHGFSSTTKTIDVLSNPMFCGDTGTRTIFAIRLTQGQARDITRYSLMPAEAEVLLPPGCRFRVQSVLPQGELTIIQIEELPSKEWIIDLSADPAQAASAAGMVPKPAPDQVQTVVSQSGQIATSAVQSAKQQQSEALEERERAAAAKHKAEEEAASLALAQRLQAQADAPAAASAAQAAAQPGTAASGRVVVRDAAALRAAVADKGGAPVVELDPAGGVFALGTEDLEIKRPVRL